MLDYALFLIIKLPILPSVLAGFFLLVLFYVGCTAHQSSIPVGYLHLWVKGHQSPFYFFWSLLSFYQGCWMTRKLWMSFLHSWGSWWSRSQEVGRYYNGPCRGTLEDVFGGPPGLGLLSSPAKVSACRLKDICIFTPRKGILLSLCLDDFLTVNFCSICPVGHAVIWQYCLQGTRRMLPCL